MSDLKTIIDRALAHELVTDVIEEQVLNLAQSRARSRRTVETLTTKLNGFARQVAEAVLRGTVPAPDVSAPGWKSDFAKAVWAEVDANDAEGLMPAVHAEACDAGLVEPSVVKRGFEFCKRFYFKIAIYVSQVSWMIRHGFDPKYLMLSQEEADADMLERAAEIRKGGGNVAVVPTTGRGKN